MKGHPQETAFGGIQFKPSLMDRQSKALLQLLSGKRIQEEPWWPDYCNHVKRRNLIVHAGLEVDRDGAMASLKVALSFQRWLLDVSKAMLSHGGGTLADDTQHQTP